VVLDEPARTDRARAVLAVVTPDGLLPEVR